MEQNKIRITGIEETPFHTLTYHRLDEAGKLEQAELPFLKLFVDYLPDGLDVIVACADLQGRWRDGTLIGSIVAAELEILSQMEQLPTAKKTGILLCGDFFSREGLDRRGGTGDVSDVWRSFAKRFRWCVGVAGNHDIFSAMPDEKAFNKFKNDEGIHFLDASYIEKDRLKIFGISGIIGNPRKVFRKTEESFIGILKSSFQKNPDILLLHEGPDIPDLKYDGNPLIRKSLESKNPLLLICGHKHWENIYIQFDELIQVVNAHERVLVFLKDTK